MKTKLNICTIGGGSGMPVVNSALIGAGFENIDSIVTTFDSGGDTGRMRTDERGKIMAFSDYWRTLMSLWKDAGQKEQWEEMLRFRDGRGRNFGNIFFQFMSEKVGSLTAVDDLFTGLTGANMNGRVIPIVLKPANVYFKTQMKKEYLGEHMLDELRMSRDKVVDIYLKPQVKANPEVLTVISRADVIIFCPGSMYGSVIVNLLPLGVKEALIQNKGKKILLTNIMSMANENHGFDQEQYVNEFKKFLGKGFNFDLVIMPDLGAVDNKLLSDTLKFYEMENSYPIKVSPNYLGTKTLVSDVAIIEAKNMRLRHSKTKLAKLFKSLLQ